MTQEEKAIRYDKALERAKEVYQRGYYVSGDIFNIFPELKEIEDEKIRKVIIEHFAGSHSSMYPYKGFTKEQILAWLEKQKFTQKDVDDAYLKGVCDTKHELEKQGENSPILSNSSNIGKNEQKPVDMVEPKFKEE